jgi:flagellar biosynthetic protein FliR
MQFTSAEIGAWVGQFMWPLIRISGLFIAMPVITTRGVPMQLRMVLAVVITMGVMSAIPSVPLIDPLTGEGIILITQQFIIGVSLGFTLRIVFAALITAGHVTALGMGLGFASMVDPSNGVQIPVLSMFYSIMGTLLFLAFDGHLVTIQVLAESFHILPIGQGGLAMEGVWDLISWTSWIFAGAVMIALPAVTAILIVNISFGVMTRASPQLNIFAVGFPLIMVLGFLMMFLTLPSIVPRFSDLTLGALELMRHLLKVSAA